jgi:hypothetical protein
MRYSLCSYSLHRTVEAGEMDVFGYNRFCKEVGYTQLDPWNYHIVQAYDDNGYLAELKASGIERTPDDGDEIGAAKKSLALLKRTLEGFAWR